MTLVDESNSMVRITRLDELNEGLNGSLFKTKHGIDFLFLAANSRGSNKGPLKSAILHSLRKRPFSFLSSFSLRITITNLPLPSRPIVIW